MKKLVSLLVSAFIISSVTQAQTAMPKDSASFTDFYGKYKFEAGSPVEEVGIVWQDSSLAITSAMGNATMTQLGVDSFSMSYEDGIVTFKRGDDKKVKSIVITVQGTVLNGDKEADTKGTSLRRKDIMEEKKAVAMK